MSARATRSSELAENPATSEETIRQLAGHVSPRMLSRYAHIRDKVRREPIATLEAYAVDPGIEGEPQQKPPRSPNEDPTVDSPIEEKPSLSLGPTRGSPGRIRTSDPTVNSRLLYRLSYRGADQVGRTPNS